MDHVARLQSNPPPTPAPDAPPPVAHPAVATAPPSVTTAIPDGFTPVVYSNDPGGPETALVIAYALMWVLMLAFVYASFRRQQRLQARVAELERALYREHPPDSGADR